MDFENRYKKLNDQQKAAVDHIDGPVMVIAGPGTGKTELLSMRAANILRTTDTLPSNILCLTFTEAGARAMRERLSEIIGRDAYKVAIHTFHSFGSEVIASNREYFYRGAEFRAADELNQLEVLTTIFDELTHSNILASKMNDEYTYLRETLRTISELKRSGLTSDELLRILDASDAVLDFIERDIAAVFTPTITKKTTDALESLVQKLASFTPDPLPLGLMPLSAVMAHSLARAYNDATRDSSTKPITAWKKSWCEKNTRGELVLKDRKRHEKLRAISFIYYRYLQKMQEAALYDFDDMILEVIHAIETQNDLKLNLQETYQYIQVDEFQDTNLAQLRLLLNLVDNPVFEGSPNLLTVGDDDQAIYSFQGADINNILQLRAHFPSLQSIVLRDNYRSTAKILDAAHDVITQETERLEAFEPDLSKTLTPHRNTAESTTSIAGYQHVDQEMAAIAMSVATRIQAGASPSDIAILARKHSELETLLPYLADQRIPVNYERRDNILELDIIVQLELLARVTVGLLHDDLIEVDTLLPELLSHPAWGIAPEQLWRLSLDAYHEHQTWSERMSTFPKLAPLHAWFIEVAAAIDHEPFEKMIDELLGAPGSYDTDDFHSPLFEYFFSEDNRSADPETYLTFLNALRTLRSGLRDYTVDETPTITALLDYI
ncbi:MAG TPA: ATP-dependent helicase, partial [Candidatus Saccharimonadaceae bacterium]|nr:ATP-dependent helicase [Candidatus Saccharimonadaceae bacterium]